MVEIIEVNKKLGNGCTVPYVVWCTDGNKYVVKFPGNPEREKALVNEFVSSRLCNYLDLPIMKYELINVKFENYKAEMKDDIEFIEGVAFGTIYEENLLTVLNADEIKKTINYYDAIKILMFDLLIGNFDRNKGNLMINFNTKKLIMIDHTHIFNIGTIWDKYQLERLEKEKFDLSKLHKFNMNNILDSLVLNKTFYSELNKFVDKVKNIDDKFIEKIMLDLPKSWNVSDDEKNSLKNFIINRFKRIDEIIELLNLKGRDNSEI